MQTTLTGFQRAFKSARQTVDAGEDVIVTDSSGQAQYLFTRYVEDANPFAGLKDVFGAVRLGREHRSVSEKVRDRLSKKHRG
jgi:hypothetical protein